MATRRSRLQVKPNIGPKVGKAGPAASVGSKDSQKKKTVVDTAVKKDSDKGVNKKTVEENEDKKTENQSVITNVTGSEKKEPLEGPISNAEEKGCEKVDSENLNPEPEVPAENVKKCQEKKPGTYTALRTKIKAKPNLSLAGKPKRDEESSLMKPPLSPLKSPRPVIPAIKSPAIKAPAVLRPNIPPNASPLKSQIKPDASTSRTELSHKDTEEEPEKKVKTVRRQPKIDISRDDPLDKTSMKMSDLIFWNPNRNFMKVQTKPEKDKKHKEPDVNPLLQATEEENQVDEPVPEEEPLPVPQVKIGPDGNLILNEESLVIDAKKPAITEDESDVIDETDSNVTYCSFRKPRKRMIWSESETDKFYYALSSIGTDFTLMLKAFPNKTRADLKKKFMKEDRENRVKVENALRERKPFDMSVFEKVDKKEEKKIKKDTRKKKEENETNATKIEKRQRPKRKKEFINYYDDDLDNDSLDDDDKTKSEMPSPAKKRNMKTKSVNTEEQAETQFTALNQSEIVQSLGIDMDNYNHNGPLILVYSKPEDGSGETVIHVYRLQPELSQLAQNAGLLNQPVYMNSDGVIIQDEVVEEAPSNPNPEVENVMTLGSNISVNSGHVTINHDEVGSNLRTCPVSQPAQNTRTNFPISQPAQNTLTNFRISQPAQSTLTNFPISQPVQNTLMTSPISQQVQNDKPIIHHGLLENSADLRTFPVTLQAANFTSETVSHDIVQDSQTFMCHPSEKKVQMCIQQTSDHVIEKQIGESLENERQDVNIELMDTVSKSHIVMEKDNLSGNRVPSYSCMGTSECIGNDSDCVDKAEMSTNSNRTVNIEMIATSDSNCNIPVLTETHCSDNVQEHGRNFQYTVREGSNLSCEEVRNLFGRNVTVEKTNAPTVIDINIDRELT